MLQIPRHDQVLKEILRDFYTNTQLESVLGFKGGTCLYLFYGLDRFSVDLDFNLLTPSLDPALITSILSRHLTIQDSSNKYHTWLWIGSYAKNLPKIKVEISKRDYPDQYIPKDFYGLTLPTLAPDCMFAHKLCAITDRKNLQNRDLYDAHFMFSHNFPINESIIQLRTNQTLSQYFTTLTQFVEKNVSEKYILTGLGELLSDSQKDRVKATLKRDLLFDLKSRLAKP